MHQRGESTDQKSRCPHITLRFEEAPLMRLSVGRLRQVVKRDLSIAFVPQQLTSYGGLELLRRYVRRLELPRQPPGPTRSPDPRTAWRNRRTGVDRVLQSWSRESTQNRHPRSRTGLTSSARTSIVSRIAGYTE